MSYLWFSLFIVSTVLNGVLIWYVRKLIKQFRDAIENTIAFNEFIEEYESHLTAVLEMDTYAGEPTVENLLRHTKDVASKLKEIGNPFSIEQEEKQ
jgi:hypothetical protein